ncbi:class I SAM-dependent methyltransferase [Montanilutibacter psychrotolerans]|uniref:Methyltransferase domain-containing protein n=1 Tax=Montanilutibacter psychrotolerans TaxID=1327343 RepID=A0A3M8SWX3_9GAMM|nr:methyltransferase domain-containing protein [Lysobacter psychrotolerans]RNF85313.1 methyltransferase domain-containing protein [Lysobacter psychrotolerans]
MQSPPAPGWLGFLRAAAASPRRIGAIAPSGPALASLITRDVDPGKAPVLELGPGTGSFTRALLGRGLAESDLTLVEYEEHMAVRLANAFPQARVLHADAARLTRIRLLAPASFGLVISGLPLLNLTLAKLVAIVRGAMSLLRPGGHFYQFTYGPTCPVPRRVLARLDLQAHRIGGTLLNLPPASVYRIGPRTALAARP